MTSQLDEEEEFHHTVEVIFHKLIHIEYALMVVC